MLPADGGRKRPTRITVRPFDMLASSHAGRREIDGRRRLPRRDDMPADSREAVGRRLDALGQGSKRRLPASPKAITVAAAGNGMDRPDGFGEQRPR